MIKQSWELNINQQTTSTIYKKTSQDKNTKLDTKEKEHLRYHIGVYISVLRPIFKNKWKAKNSPSATDTASV